jgi:hypothetical protein
MTIEKLRLPSIGARTARDLACGLPPDQLAGEFLTPEGATILYGKGGVGKGVLACWFIGQLVAAGHIVLLVDFENHEREWGSRLRGLGLTDEQLDRVHYRAPFAPDWEAERGSLYQVAHLLRIERHELEATYLVVDSYSVATSTGDTMGGQTAAQEFYNALSVVGLPSLTVAHVAGAAVRFPDKPFGSVFVHNLARETWAVEAVNDDDDGFDADLDRFGPHVVGLELRNRKSNSRAKVGPQFVAFSFFPNGSIEVDRSAPGMTLASLADGILTTTPGMTTKEIAAAIREDTGKAYDADDIRKTMAREPRRFAVDKGKRPHRWSVS